MDKISRRSIVLAGAMAVGGATVGPSNATDGTEKGETRLYELRNYLLRPGDAGKVVTAASTIENRIRGDKYGKLEGYWLSDIGLCNQVINLWSYADFNERAKAHSELAKNQQWTKEFLSVVGPSIVRVDVRLLNVVRPPIAPAVPGNVYELRNYRAKPGAAKAWLDLFQAALPARERHSKIVGLWQTDVNQPNEICHLWAYKSLNARGDERNGANKEPEWQDFLASGGKYLDEMNSTVMMPAPHSPLL
jgi:hypothetical protein